MVAAPPYQASAAPWKNRRPAHQRLLSSSPRSSQISIDISGMVIYEKLKVDSKMAREVRVRGKIEEEHVCETAEFY